MHFCKFHIKLFGPLAQPHPQPLSKEERVAREEGKREGFVKKND